MLNFEASKPRERGAWAPEAPWIHTCKCTCTKCKKAPCTQTYANEVILHKTREKAKQCTGWEWLIRSHSSARFSFELSGNSD